jgi:hypothetical protein
MDAYHKMSNSEFIFTESEFSVLKQKIFPELDEIVQSLKKSDETIHEKVITVRGSFQM